MGRWSYLHFFVNQLWDNNIGNQSLFSSCFPDSFRTILAIVDFRNGTDINWGALFHYFHKNRYEGIQC